MISSLYFGKGGKPPGENPRENRMFSNFFYYCFR